MGQNEQYEVLLFAPCFANNLTTNDLENPLKTLWHGNSTVSCSTSMVCEVLPKTVVPGRKLPVSVMPDPFIGFDIEESFIEEAKRRVAIIPCNS